ncbi:P-loop containing nucleoside triphosphate hydrolase protein [Trichoderma citrinoviride]|uniref:P-loop containing nucleoside triphosphate hydrolase protein n=1 Tax=Trichoderma citrinoviride TaxID=58853 RepID=A0A2T4B743_9HYPO|nr:P-loop containing nucleoside triphosphate hydrolase protein [Trichoderma citrinoviride]PTB65031.1 P-loop containing nucleoside triphosphate hydrolase protein [Trichoderma citrinoviride]
MVQGENGETSSKKLHPFFTKADIDQHAVPPPLPLDPAQPTPDDAPPGTAEGPKRKRQKTDTSLILKFNPKTGTLGSPPKPKAISKPSRMVTIKYGRDDEHRKDMGNKIEEILEGKLQLSLVPSKRKIIAPKQGQAEVASEKAKSTHPFFMGKSKPHSDASTPGESVKKPSSHKTSVFKSTPVSPRKPRNPFPSGKGIQFGIKSGGTKVPGAKHPLWPPYGMAHVRGDDFSSTRAVGHDSGIRHRRSKRAAVAIAPQESVLRHLVRDLDVPGIRQSLPRDNNSFLPAPPELRVPQRHFESGRKLQKRIRSQLRSHLTDYSAYYEGDVDELANQQSSKVHPAISCLYKALEAQLSAFDRSQCEGSSWVQKYAPVTAAQVLQPGKEALLLSDWLQALRVQSVESGSSEGDKEKGKPKKKRKKNKLDGFVIDSEEEDAEMDEISDSDGDWASLPGSKLIKKSVMRSINPSKGSRLTNAIILSGPHGSGKTAAVYAVAKELDFEIFEINPGSRRSGKDILEKVGDMTRNHLVQHNRGAADPTAIDPEEVASEINSGKQGMMTSFFQPKPKLQPAKPQRAKQSKEKESVEKEAKAPPKSQKQSLILLEEVDVLFEEDKQFWATLTSLIAQSKRPFIMTCNDESLLPIQSLNLHGIFRFSAAPLSTAVDLCLLIAANEGHALQRSAVEALYNSRDRDLRATITELNYWCQIGVGDRKGGYDWFYLRWPKGSDLDENGDVVRVISQDAYQKGMGWFNRDPIVATSGLDAEQEAIEQVWDFWSFDMGDWCNGSSMNAWAAKTATSLGTLEAYDDFCTAMSSADICSGGAYGVKLQEVMDPTIPDLATHIREDFILGQALLDADVMVHHAAPNKAISTCIKSLARATVLNSSTEPHDAARESAKASALRPIDEGQTVSILDSFFRSCPHQMTRMDIAIAFDPIAVPPKVAPTTYLDPSVFDRTMNLIVLDVAPWVRGIVAYEHQLMLRRLKLSNLMSEGGKRKRMRTTRSAYSALEGGERRTTRRERHFGECLSTHNVLRTGGDRWTDLVTEEMAKSEMGDESTAASSPASDDIALP